MSGIYIHIPFCKQACHYCDFHFSTSLKKKDELIEAIQHELVLRKNELPNQFVETIYFGGGTPSLLTLDEIDSILKTIYDNYDVSETPEITLEANPDDLNEDKILELAKSDVNRLSIGIQSFFEDDLKLMNRAHNADEAYKCLDLATTHFDNISIDLIYGIPGLSNDYWLKNIETALSYNLPHISSYALTVEPKTALAKFIENGKIPDVDDEVAQQQYNILVNKLEASGFVNYEISNFGKPGWFSKNNTAYWLGKPYLGIGPSAHSYDGISRSWNVANNSKYIKSITENKLPSESETLSQENRFNEAVMTGLRTVWGVSLAKIEAEFGQEFLKHLMKNSQKYISEGLLELKNPTIEKLANHEVLTITKKGKFLCDGIASDLFILN
ncbi:oxygen-independent coproporphyrinogen-3 oxidase [Flavobacteriaceae bacterium MAR_2010_188]|nr:oxygen-independent coproporphyrinogen-3 oxidase [Flavobacteriaceae bacterium MAR_2010_188]